MNTEKIWRILDATNAAAQRDGHNGLGRAWESYISTVSMWDVWQEEGREDGDPAPMTRPSQKGLLEILASHGYRYNATKNEVTKK